MAYPQLLKKSALFRTVAILFVMNLLMGSLFLSPCYGWLIFHKPAYKGRVIDATTGKPIEGVVAVAVYYVEDIIGGPGGPNSWVKNYKEAQTDKDGIFCISSYTRLMGPNSAVDKTEFIFYKPGFCVYWGETIPDYMKVGPDKYFTEKIGKKGETFYGTIKDISPEGRPRERDNPLSFNYGIVKLQPIDNREERLTAMPDSPYLSTSKELPLFFKALNQERQTLGLGGRLK